MIVFPDLHQADLEWFVFKWKNVLVPALWEPGRVWGSNEYCRPLAPTGYLYRASTAGMSGSREPSWQSTTTNDGSVVWTTETVAAASEPTIASVVYTLFPSGLVEADTAIDNSKLESSIQIDATGAQLGTYKITAVMTDSNGEDSTVEAQFKVVA